MSTAVPPRLRWDRARFYRAVEAGVFPEGGRVELLDGEVFEHVPETPAHAAAVRRLRAALERAIGDAAAFVSEAHPIALTRTTSDPQPDAVVVRGRLEDYEHRHPSSADVLVVAEVSASTRAFGLGAKARLYALEGLDPYLVVQLTRHRVVVHREPVGDAYGLATVVEDGEVPLPAPLTPLPVAALLPR